MGRDGSASAEDEAAEAPQLGVGFVLGRVGHAMALRFDRDLAPFGLRASHLGLMSAVRAFGPLPQQRLADFLGADRATINALVDELEARALVERRAAPEDRRTKTVSLTDDGRQLHTRADAAARAHERTAFAMLEEAEREELRRLLLKIASGSAILVAPTSPAAATRPAQVGEA